MRTQIIKSNRSTNNRTLLAEKICRIFLYTFIIFCGYFGIFTDLRKTICAIFALILLAIIDSKMGVEDGRL